jgi:hypothetical protein
LRDYSQKTLNYTHYGTNMCKKGKVGEIDEMDEMGEMGKVGEVGEVEMGWKETEIWQIYSRFD